MSLSEILGSRIRQWGLSPDEVDAQVGRWTLYEYDFIQKNGATLELPWATSDASAAGTPTLEYVTGYDGVFRGLLDVGTSEVETIALHWNDLLAINEDGKFIAEFDVKFIRGAALASTDQFICGLYSEYNATFGSMTNQLNFACIATTTSFYCRCDDGTTDTGNVITSKGGYTMVDDTWYTLRIDASIPENVRFLIAQRGTGNTSLVFKDVTPTTGTFTTVGMAGLQPIIGVTRAASTRAHSFLIDKFRVLTRKRGSE